LGIAIGVVSTLFIYPKDTEFLGIIRYIDGAAQLLYPVLVFGAAQTMIHFYPIVSNSNKHLLFKYGLFTILIMGLLVSSLLISGYFLLEYDNYVYLLLALPLTVMLALVELFKRQATNLQKLAVPTFYEKIIPKVALPLVFLLFLSHYLSLFGSIWVYIFSYIFLMVLMGIYVFKNMQFTFDFNFKPLFTEVSKKSYYQYSLYVFAGSFGSFFAFRVDSLMIPEFLSFDSAGIYNIGVTLASSIAIPATGLFALYAPVVSNYIKTNDIAALGMKYRETSKLLFFIGAVFFGSVVVGVESLFELMPSKEKLVQAIPIIYVLGANVLVNMATGFNTEIINYSNYYKFNLQAILTLVFVNVGLNLFFLTQTDLGILGVAYASLIAMTIFNIAKTYFIYTKFQILPFDSSFFQLFLLLTVLVLVIYFLPNASNLWLNVCVKTISFGLLAVILTYQFKLVFSVNEWVDKLLRKFNIGR
jgi:O-antigen/teichoic acid export membrane protein